MKTILATAYAINPYKGSEDGMGWNLVCQIAQEHKVIAITRENNREKIEQYMAEHPNAIYANIQFYYFDLPYWMRFWKKGGRGAMLYYWMWQKGIVGFIKQKGLQYDIVHNLNFHNDWTPSYLWKLNKPFVWGPIGHHPLIPAQYLKPYSKTYLIKDRLTWAVKKYFWRFSGALRRTANKADAVLCMNHSVENVLKIAPERCHIMPSVATEDYGWHEHANPEGFTAITSGRLIPLKGYDLSILAFVQFLETLNAEERAKAKLIIVGSGEEELFYKQLVAEHHIEANVKFIPWIQRQELLVLYKQANVFLFPSHEGAGMVVAEALSFGLPVVCLDNCGPGEFIDNTSGIAVPIGDYDNTVKHLANALKELYSNKDYYKALRYGARQRFEKHFHWDRRGEQLAQIYQKIS